MPKGFSFDISINQPHHEALDLTKAALQHLGFGVITSIDVRETMREKLDIDFRPYTILGACNPRLANRALNQDATVGLLLPCNVTVEAESEASSIVRIANPEMLLSVGFAEEDGELQNIAKEARHLLELVAEELGSR
jgi:uncharacterized protein (DUF302 family)